MITKKTVLVLGAGASQPYGFPTGQELMNEIQHLCETPNSPTRIHMRVAGAKEEDVEDLLKALKVTQLASIDSLLEQRPSLKSVGKLAIAAVLIPKENAAKLRPREDHWYRQLFQNLVDRQFDGSKVTVISLNYDRSLEQYLFETLKADFSWSDDDASRAVQQIDFIHLHGQLGFLPWWNKDVKGSRRAYAATLSPEVLKGAANDIVIVSEFDEKNFPFMMRVQSALNSADVVGFLGFGYHRDVLERLKLTELSARREELEFFGSAYCLPRGRRSELGAIYPGIIVGDEQHRVGGFLNDCTLFFQSGTGSGGPGSRRYRNMMIRRGVIGG